MLERCGASAPVNWVAWVAHCFTVHLRWLILAPVVLCRATHVGPLLDARNNLQQATQMMYDVTPAGEPAQLLDLF